MPRMTGRQRALHEIEQALAHFTPQDRDEMARGIMGLQLLFQRKPQDRPEVEAAFSQLEGGIVDLLSSSATSFFSKAGRDRWADGLIVDAGRFAPDLCARARRFAR